MGVPMFRGWHTVGGTDEYVQCFYCGSLWAETAYFDDDGFTVRTEVTDACNGVGKAHVPECECACCAYGCEGECCPWQGEDG